MINYFSGLLRRWRGYYVYVPRTSGCITRQCQLIPAMMILKNPDWRQWETYHTTRWISGRLIFLGLFGVRLLEGSAGCGHYHKLRTPWNPHECCTRSGALPSSHLLRQTQQSFYHHNWHADSAPAWIPHLLLWLISFSQAPVLGCCTNGDVLHDLKLYLLQLNLSSPQRSSSSPFTLLMVLLFSSLNLPRHLQLKSWSFFLHKMHLNAPFPFYCHHPSVRYLSPNT